jgi:hypothetical protein
MLTVLGIMLTFHCRRILKLKTRKTFCYTRTSVSAKMPMCFLALVKKGRKKCSRCSSRLTEWDPVQPLSIDELKSAIVHDDATTLQKIKGIGGKTAQRVIIELKDKLKKDAFEEIIPSGTGVRHNTLRNEALSALITLGINKSAAEKSVDSVLKKSGNTLTLEDLVKQALKNA